MAKQRLSVVEAARLLGITLDATYRLLKVGKLASRKVAKGRYSISRKDVMDRKATKDAAKRQMERNRKKAA